MKPNLPLLFLVSLGLAAVGAAVCGDGQCDYITENCFSCASDCSCAFDGVRFDSWSCGPSALSCAATTTSLSEPVVSNFLPAVNGPVTGRLSGYLKVDKLTHVTLWIDGQNVGARLNVDGSLVIDSFLVQAKMNSSVEVALSEDNMHFFILEFFSLTNVAQRNVRLLWKTDSQGGHDHSGSSSSVVQVIPELFFTMNTCGDHVSDPQEKNSSSKFYCPNEAVKVAMSTSLATCASGVCVPTSQCGNGVCMELFVDDCFVDCHSYITRTCNTVAVKPGLVSDVSSSDTLGDLIKNQMLMHLPGIEHMASGINIITGKESQAPLFYYSYCDAENVATIQDSYRGMVYTVPDGLYAIPSPKCVFSASAQVFNSTVEMANSYADKYAYDVGISGELNVDTLIFGAYSASGAFSYSKEKSVEAARSLRQQRSGSIAVAEVICETSKVQQSTLNLHPIFLRDLSLATNSSDISKLMSKYGTHYYKSATLGGRLRQVTVIDHQFTSKSSEREIRESSKLSLSAAISGKAYGITASLSGSYASSKDSTINTQQQGQFESSSSRSTVITYGGPPGSFGPTTSEAPSNFGDWASAVDLLPVPIDYQLVPIYHAIHPLWKTRGGTSIRELWKAAQTDFRDSYGALNEASRGFKYTLNWLFSTSNMNSQSQPAVYDLVFEGRKYRVVDLNGPPGSYAPLGSVSNIASPLMMDFFHPQNTWTASSAAPYVAITASTVTETSLFDSFFKVMDWQTSILRASTRNSANNWQYQSDWNTRMGLHFVITKVEGIDLPGSGNSITNSLEFTIKGDTPNKNFVYYTEFPGSAFPTTSTKTRSYYLNIPITSSDPNRITVVKSVGIRFGTRNAQVGKVTFAISKLWTAHNIAPNPNTDATVFSMGDGTVTLSNFDKAPQQIPMFSLKELY